VFRNGVRLWWAHIGRTTTWAFTLAGRYFDRVYATIDNIDAVSHTYQGFEAFMTWDARVAYDIDENWTAAVSLENLGGNDVLPVPPVPATHGQR